MKRASQASDNSSSQRPRIDMPATAAPPPGAAATRAPTVTAGDQRQKPTLLQAQHFFSAAANNNLATLQGVNPALITILINAPDRASGLTPLMLAVKSRSADMAHWLISQGASLDLPCARGTNALMYAAKRGDCEMVQLLLAAGAQLGQADPEGRTALHHAAMQGKEKAVALLLDRGATLEQQDAEGNTALLLALVNQHAAVIGLLVERGANAAHLNKCGRFPLGYLKSEAVATALLQKPINLQQQSEWQTTALINASGSGACEIVTLLMDHGAEMDFADNKGTTALATAIKEQRHAVVKLLLDRGANTACTVPLGLRFHCGMLGLAARGSDIAAMQLLVDAGAEINQRANEALSALFVAADFGHKEAVQWLLERKASVDAVTKDGTTALMAGSARGRVDVVELLLQHRASTTSMNKGGLNALHFAVANGKDECAVLLLRNGANLKEKTADGLFPLHLAAREGHEKTIALLLDQGIDVDQADDQGRTALIHAAKHGHLPALKFLLSKNANSNARLPSGRSALHIAASAGKDKVVAELVKQPGVEIDSRDKDGATALFLAALDGHQDAVHRLLDNGADPCEVVYTGWNVLHAAAFYGDIAVVETLLSSESDMAFIDHANNDGFTSLLLASQKGKAEVVRLLADRGADLRVREKRGGTALYHGACFGHSNVAEVLLEMLLLRVPGNPDSEMPIILEALMAAINAGHAGVVEVFLRSQPGLASLDFRWHASPVISDLHDKVRLVISQQDADDELTDQFPGLANCVKRFEQLLDMPAAANDSQATLNLGWLVSPAWYSAITANLQEATKGIAALRRTLAGAKSEVSPAHTKLICAGILARLGEPSIFNTPYSGKGLSPALEACFNRLALHQAHLLARAGQQAEQDLVNAVANLHGTCMGSFTGNRFHHVDLYLYLTRQCGLYDIPAKRISDAFAETWLQHDKSDTAVRERAFAQALANRSRSREALEPIAHDSAQAGNEIMFHWLLNRQLDLVNAWHKEVLGTAVQ
ncbi:MAG: ankyrin repeat domain-containing protein [Burkholderiaceae bacterium]